MKRETETLKKRVRQVTGTQVGITFTKEEREIYNIELGDIINLSDMFVIKKNG